MGEYLHSLFFEARDLTDREIEKVRRHFQKRRESGGGECGLIEKVGVNTYKISFKEKEDQERALLRKLHNIPFPDGELCLIVSRSIPSQTPDQPSTSQPQTSANVNTKSLEKIFHVDVFLLYYLRDSLKASKVLQKQLSSIGCTVELNSEEEEAVVRGEIEKSPGGAFGGSAENWELQVDRVFINITESYVCYHVLEPEQVKILLQDLSFVTDELKVYTESGYAVIVGEDPAVKERVAILEKSVLTRKEIPIVEKQFKLIEEDFNREICAHQLNVRILRSSGLVSLEGPDKEVQSGATILNELIKKIKEKRVPLPTAVIIFIKSSGAISKYQACFQQSLRSPVSIEVGSDLVLSSLSSDALEEAEATLLRDISIATVRLQDTEAVSPNLDRLKEILVKAKNEANQGELRVDISFITGTSGLTMPKVRLVGYSENVNKLKEILHEYQMNQVPTQEVVNLPNPEVVDCFDKILHLKGMKLTNVNLKALHSPIPCVLVSGPRSEVQEAKQALFSTFANFTSDTLVLDGPGAQRFFQTNGKVGKELVERSCQVIIREQQGVKTPKPQQQSISNPSSNTSRFPVYRGHFKFLESVPVIPVTPVTLVTPVNKANLRIKTGSLEDEQVNILVVPMLNKQLTSTKIGKSLLTKAKKSLKSNFDSLARKCTLTPGDVLEVNGPPTLGCSKIFFIECLPWDGVRGKSVQALGNGLKKCLDLCTQQRLSSVAFPVIGPGIVFKYPLTEAIQVLTDSICQFESSASTLSDIHIVIKPGYPDSEKCYHEIHKRLSSNMNHGGQAIFRSLTSDLDDITITLGGRIKLKLVFGDIINETTDAVVNTTDFKSFHYDGVCKDILTVAGPEVEAELKAAQVNRGDIVVTQPGKFPCKTLFHLCGEKDAGLIEKYACSIIDRCETFELKSVAIPAMCAGVGGMDPGVVAGAILRGIKTATSSTPLNSVTDIRLVLFKINVFLAFKEEAMQMFSSSLINRGSVPQHAICVIPRVPQDQPVPSVSADRSILHTSSASQQSVFLFLGFCRKNVDDAMAKLKDLYQTQCSTQTFKKEELEGLTQDDIHVLKQLVETHGLYVQEDLSGSLTVSGLKDEVNQAMMLINASLNDRLRREMRAREEEELYTRVAWCIMGHNGNWERLPKTTNCNLEKKDLARRIMDAQGAMWIVDLQSMEAERPLVGQKRTLKRLENLPDFTLPLYWDSMAVGENMKVVALLPSSAEYQTVKEDFKRTVPKAVMKIERVQNIHLRRAYEVRKKHISDTNAQEGGAGEKFLYHGTTQENCDSIMKTGFNRRFAGQNATSYGHGTYFAVNASYSAHPTYSKPAADGSQLMFVARVLTGIYTQGSSDMKVPPPRNSQQPNERYDSVVDKMDDPYMYVVFHDNQAYPDYRITFK